MIMRIAILSTLFSLAVSLKRSSLSTKRLISNSRRLENGEEEDYAWLINYSIKFESCYSLTQLAGEENGGGEEGGSNLFTQKLVKFKLCDIGSCSSSCIGGEYVSDLVTFVDAYTENKLEEEEYNCEMVRENCYCDDADDEDSCEQVCYETAGLDYCVEENMDDDQAAEEMNVQEYLECRELGLEDYYNVYDNNGDAVQLFAGPKCASNGQSINLAIYLDETCSIEAGSAAYTAYKQGYREALPYMSQSLVDSNKCVSCLARNDDDDDAGDAELSQMCEEIYEPTSKCETNMNIDYKNEQGCDFISALGQKDDNYVYAKSSLAPALAWIFALSTIGLAAYVYTLHNKREINLTDSNGQLA